MSAQTVLNSYVFYRAGTEFNDLFVLDTSEVEWAELDGMISGVAPLGRRFLGFTSCSGQLFIFGGYNINLGWMVGNFQ